MVIRPVSTLDLVFPLTISSGNLSSPKALGLFRALTLPGLNLVQCKILPQTIMLIPLEEDSDPQS